MIPGAVADGRQRGSSGGTSKGLRRRWAAEAEAYHGPIGKPRLSHEACGACNCSKGKAHDSGHQADASALLDRIFEAQPLGRYATHGVAQAARENSKFTPKSLTGHGEIEKFAGIDAGEPSEFAPNGA